MLTYLSKKITNYYINKNSIEEADRDVYNYCFEILLATILNLLAVVVIAVATKTYLTSLLFVLSFMLMRSAAGGYHADTHLRCFLVLMFVYSGLILCVYFVPAYLFKYIGMGFALASLILIVLIAPIDSPNNSHSKEKRKKLKIKSLILIALITFAGVPLMFFSSYPKLGFALAYGAFSVMASCVFGLIKNTVILAKQTR